MHTSKLLVLLVVIATATAAQSKFNLDHRSRICEFMQTNFEEVLTSLLSTFCHVIIFVCKNDRYQDLLYTI